jgi:amidase
LSPGGSSGGEAALLALRGSFIGIGTDIGGSVRIPGAFTNLYSLRPSFGRFPTYGSKTALAGQEAINSVNGMLPFDCTDLGPLGHTPRDINLYSKIIVDSQPWLVDPKVVCIPWRSIELPAKLSFAVIKSNKVVNLLPPVARGLEIAISKLKEAGHEIIEWGLSDQREVADLSVFSFPRTN